MKFFSCLLLLLLILSSAAHAGVLVLRNGDRYEGDLLRIRDGELTWDAAMVGEVTVDVAGVREMAVDRAVKMDGHARPCDLEPADNGVVRFECEDGEAGQVDIMALDLVEPFSHYQNGNYNYRGELTLSGRQASGNLEERSWALDSDTLFRRGDFRHESRVQYDSIALDQEDAEDRGLGRYSVDWFFDERWFWYNNLQFGFDEPADIQERYVYGTGLGYQVWETADSALSVESGFDYIKERFEDPEAATPDFVGDNKTAAWRWALDYRHQFPAGVSLYHQQDLIRSVEVSKDWRLDTETGVQMPLPGRLSSRITLDYNVDNTPVEGNRREDKQISVGVGYSW